MSTLSGDRKNQFELFPEQDRAREPGTASVLRRLTLSLEQLFVLCILLIIALVVSFVLGFERGRSSLREDIASLQIKTDNSRKNAKIAPISVSEPAAPIRISVSGPAGKPPAAAEIEQRAKARQVDDQKVEILRLPEIEKIYETKASEQLPSGAYTVQVASFKKKETAQKEADVLKQKGFTPYLSRKGDYTIVCVGRFDAHKQAERFSAKLRTMYKDLLVRRM